MPRKHFICKSCGKTFERYKRAGRNIKNCSKKCADHERSFKLSFREAKKLYELGYSHKEVGRILKASKYVVWQTFKKNGYKSRDSKTAARWGENHRLWKKRGASLPSLHQRINRRFGRPKECWVCGTTDPNRTYDWANLSGNYEDITDYKRMCRSCHCKYDYLRRKGYMFPMRTCDHKGCHGPRRVDEGRKATRRMGSGEPCP